MVSVIIYSKVIVSFVVISIPLSFFGGIGGASKIGILIKGSNYLEGLAKSEIIVFDKTGTLTEGVFEVQKIEAVGITEEKLIRYAALAESFSNHPIAQSVKKAYGKKIDSKLVTSTNELTGLGIESIIEDRDVIIGNEKLMISKNIDYNKCKDIGTVLYVAIDQKYCGYILISDRIKEDSKVAIKQLKNSNVSQTVMLTGDKKDVGEFVANEIGLDKVYTDLLPDGKVEKVEELMKQKSEKGKLV